MFVVKADPATQITVGDTVYDSTAAPYTVNELVQPDADTDNAYPEGSILATRGQVKNAVTLHYHPSVFGLIWQD